MIHVGCDDRGVNWGSFSTVAGWIFGIWDAIAGRMNGAYVAGFNEWNKILNSFVKDLWEKPEYGIDYNDWLPPPQLILFLESTPFCQFFPIVHLSQVEKMHMWLTQSMSSASHVSFCHFKDVKLTKLGTTKKNYKVERIICKKW